MYIFCLNRNYIDTNLFFLDRVARDGSVVARLIMASCAAVSLDGAGAAAITTAQQARKIKRV